MHDFHLANQILKIVLEYAKKYKLKEINLIKIELGEMIEHGERILPENLKYNFQLLAKETPAQKAKLEIKLIKKRIWRIKEIEGK